jgi:hypothetical protein
MSARPTASELHEAHHLEAVYARREARTQARHDQAILDERALSQRRADALVQAEPIEDGDFPGCYW